MFTKRVRQRSNPTFQQSFYFTDQPTDQQAVKKCIDNHCQKCSHCMNIIEHPILRSDTNQQKLHKQILGKYEKQQIKQMQTVTFMPKQLSTNRKQKQLRGQLEQGGVYFFYRQPLHKCNHKHAQKLIPTDCRFNHTCHGRIGTMNQYCSYHNRDYDRFLKQKYDLKQLNTNCQLDGPTYVFKERIKNKNKKL